MKPPSHNRNINIVPAEISKLQLNRRDLRGGGIRAPLGCVAFRRQKVYIGVRDARRGRERTHQTVTKVTCFVEKHLKKFDFTYTVHTTYR